MKIARLVRGVALSLAALGVCVPQIAFAVEPAPAILDVALADGGVLHGQVLNTQGVGAAGMPVYIRAQERDVAAVTTAANGAFSVQGLKGGVYQVSTLQGHGVYRLWSPGTAPPAAQNGAIVYTQSTAVDSGVVHYTQNGSEGGGLKMLLANPVVIAGVVATAVALPIALNQWHHTPVSH